ncbi:MAG: cysteine synthase A [Bacillota bacterium]
MSVYDNVTELIGDTPLVRIKKLIPGGGADILVKLESFNPGGSVKDRIGYSMIREAEESGELPPEGTIVEPTSGNTGIGLAFIGAARGYRVVLTMPDTMSVERRNLLKALGAELMLTPGEDGMTGAIEKAKALAAENENYFMPQQFNNQANPKIHRETTAREILKDIEGTVDYFVAGVGTGGTLTGVGEVLKKEFPTLKVVAVEPKDSAVLSGKKAGSHKIQGIGAGFIPNVLNTDIIDEIITISNQKAIEVSRRLAAEEGIFAGISSGAALAASIKVAKKADPDKTIVTIAPDTGERYLSTELFAE